VAIKGGGKHIGEFIEYMKALSIRQPWAWLICAGYKDIENRNWRIGRKAQHEPYSSYHQANFTIEVPVRIYVHASKILDTSGAKYFNITIPPNLPLGAIIGEVDIIDCITESASPWFSGRYGFVLANPILYEIPIPCQGALGFFEPDTAQMKRSEQ
jgi:hypothetical protein